ncbi:GGDEF domain-containing protein [Pelomonas sp. V22]|uniref:tetratricopeptide repeat-containing diguanylate cyclase n=1 Tax=Pelomonas sp. V22 TaxID=2822139 RepID=UPI0024A7D92D|nr:tetratricopeptide repeat-containing diguanylate cyclase [Pelomonas sp. V22]MDI4634592.1 GGDEF domain-containing protein [Pelomonas sp. V22]
MARTRLLPLLAALLLQMPVLAQVLAAGPLQPLEAQLAQLEAEGSQDPDAALAKLGELRVAEGLQQRVIYTRARILLDVGRTEAAEALIKQLAAHPEQEGRVQLLRAMQADRRGDDEAAVAGAGKAVGQLEKTCPVGDERAAVERGSCDFRAQWQALRILQQAQRDVGANQPAQALAQRGLALAQAGRDGQLVVVSSSDLALLAQAAEQPEEMQRWLEQMMLAAEGDSMRMYTAMTTQAVVAGRGGNKQAQLQFQLRGLEIAQQAGALRHVARAQSNLADYYMHRGEPARALELARKALPVMQRFKDRDRESVLHHNMAVALLRLRQFDAARREIALADQLRLGGGQRPVVRARQLRELGEALAEAGLAREAIAMYHEERALTVKVNERAQAAALEALRTKYDRTRGQRDLELLQRDRSLKDQELANSRLAQQVGVAVAVLLGLLVVLGGVMVRRVQLANKKLKANEALLRAQSERDPLTELANRRHFLAVMEQQAANQFDGALLMVDIDHFKHVNDRHGHAAGDIVICEVARRLSHAVRQQDLVVRWGGEEFLVFAPGVAQSQLHGLAERILFSVGAEPINTEDGPLNITVSIGFAHFPLPPMRLALHWEQAVNWADMALYTAKSQGRNRAMGIATVDAQDADTLQQIEADFDAACSSQRVSLQQILGPQRGEG